MDYRKESLKLHGQWKGKIEVNARARLMIRTRFHWHTHRV